MWRTFCILEPQLFQYIELMNNTLANGLRLLDLLSATAEAHSVTDLAQRLAVPKSHAHRLLQTLVEQGYAVQDGDRRYRIGMEPLVVSKALLANHPLRRAARPILHRLTAATGLDAIATIPHRGGCALVLAAAHPDGEQRDASSSIGNRLPFPGTASATLFAALVEGFADPAPIEGREAIVRDRFVWLDPSQRAEVNAMAAAVCDPSGAVVGALGISGPRQHFAAVQAAARIELRAAADLVALAIAQSIRPTA